MANPAISEDQRIMAVAMLANAIRKERRFRARAADTADSPGTLAAIGARRQKDASSQYVRGMYDLLAVLFDGGRAVADQCYLAAESDATSPVPPSADR